jgi:SAM-dependent methyltransferase
MKPALLDRLRCPACGGPLSAADAVRRDDGEIVEGTLDCACGRTYPIIRSIPRFVPSENYALNFGFQWNHFPTTQLDSYTGHPISGDRFRRETGWTEDDLRDAVVLDAGCGAGRFAEVALQMGATVIAIDYSDAIDAAAQNLRSERVAFVQADILSLPFAPESFDFIYSLGVLQHTPDARGAIASLVKRLRAGGRITVDFYRRRLANWTHPKYWLRPVTTRIPPPRLFKLLQRSVPAMLRVSRALRSVPLAGRILSRLVPVANYSGILPLDDAQLSTWALLDTFDWFSPRYDKPQTAKTLRRWLESMPLDDVDVFLSDHLTGRGTKAHP